MAITRGRLSRSLHIAHRRSPSELTPLIAEQLALQKRLEQLQQQQQQIISQQQQMGISSSASATNSAFRKNPAFPSFAASSSSPSAPSFSLPQPNPDFIGHRRAQSTNAFAESSSAPMPPPSSISRQASHPSAHSSISGHGRRHSLALTEAKRAAAISQQLRTSPSSTIPGQVSQQAYSATSPTVPSSGVFQFPPPSSSPDKGNSSPTHQGPAIHIRSPSNEIPASNPGTSPHPTSHSRFSSLGHSRSTSTHTRFGHERASSRSFLQSNYDGGFNAGNRRHAPSASVSSISSQSHGQRKSLFTPYLPQAALPGLIAEGKLVAGILRVNKKNRSDAYVSTGGLLDADIYICGSKDRNRALEGDLVAVELLAVDEVWNAKRDKEEKKKRRDLEEGSTANSFGLQRRGSLRQRPIQKKNDDVEVEGQSILLTEEEEINDELKPLYAGHVVAIIDRVPGQLFSGNLGLLRPSSQATKDKQDVDRKDTSSKSSDRPKIVWFKPTDKRVPLVAIPIEQAPSDFVENHQSYADKLFVASIKRWPITSLHPFGTLVEELGSSEDAEVEIKAILRDNNFVAEEFSETLIRSCPADRNTLSESLVSSRHDLRHTNPIAIAQYDVESGSEIAVDYYQNETAGRLTIHIADVSNFLAPGSALEREARKRGSSACLSKDRIIQMLPPEFLKAVGFVPGKERVSIAIQFDIDRRTYETTAGPRIFRAVIKPENAITYEDIDSIHDPTSTLNIDARLSDTIKALAVVAKGLRQRRYGVHPSSPAAGVPILRVLDQLDDELVYISDHIFASSPSVEMMSEISIQTNSIIAKTLYDSLGGRALLRHQPQPFIPKLSEFSYKMQKLGLYVDVSSGSALCRSLFQITDDTVRHGLETLLVKYMERAKYYVPEKVDPDFYEHYLFNLPVYTHFDRPFSRYADIVTHQQLSAVLTNSEYNEDIDGLAKAAEHYNFRKESSANAQMQAIHLRLCQKIDQMSKETGQLICDGLVINVYDSAFDVLIPEFGIEKRVHGDQLPLHKAEYNKETRTLELFWQKGVDPATYVPVDEQESALSLPNPLEEYLKNLKVRVDGNNYIQEINELRHVPIILRADLGKSSLPCLSVRTLNPFLNYDN
ncbi:hypothetical protein CANCADRAFT_55517 [Tortispora caseinolytica NRRL Y-17796]|uniref:RNB domain-containing protein n=1 Tax=Tortispora caseinolytica NRRL Y-17796 TaxID=767744 RepID=A0A1E4TJ48_9ASCO|nr:hypothetical protein CANCADRAFT_55517 [Tortispora caseinolytica NRRL Y-17796]